MKRFLLFIAIAILYNPGFGQTLPANFSYTNITPGFTWTAPVGATFTNDGLKFFVWERSGKVYVCNRNGSDYVKQTTPVIDISPEVLDNRDFGLLGFALDPSFQSNGLIYLLYVVDRRFLMNNNSTPDLIDEATIGRVTRYKTVINGSNVVADLSTRTILIGETAQTGMAILHQSHGIGSLAFAADGTLLVTCGDGACYNHTDAGSDGNTDGGITFYQQALNDGIIRPEENVGAFRSQLLNSHNGKLLRINPENGDGVSSNPFFEETDPRSPKSRVWAFGFRNPFRMTVKKGSGSTNPSAGDIGEVFIGDVGWSTWEELNVVKAPGTNFGWPLYEGLTVRSSYMNLNTQNRDEPNAFGSCNGRSFYRFKDLLKQDNELKDKTVTNPCNSNQVIGTHNRHIHARPAIDWQHGGVDNARVGKFNGSGVATNPTIGTPESEVLGVPFRGNCTAGGVWYTGAGNSFPPEFKNTFIAADYQGNWLKRITIDYTDVVTKVDNFATNMGPVVCLVENPIDGSLVCINVGSSTIRKITYGGNIPPFVKVRADKYYSSSSSLTVNFDGSESYDQDGSIASYAWNFGDPGSPVNSSNSASPSHQFTSTTGPRKFVVTLTITDNGGETTTEEFIISVNNTPPEVEIISPVKNSLYTPGADTSYMRSASVSDNEHSGSDLIYEWQTTLVHNTHTHPESINSSVQSPTIISRIGCNGDEYSWLVTLNVTDAAGLSTIDSSMIFPNCAGTLPIFLHKFSVTQAGSINLVKWTTEMESNMEYFELERSTDGVNFRTINRQPASNTIGPNNYSYTDNNFLAGTNYYRLKMVEAGSVISYSIIIKTVTEGEKNVLRIAPNPVINNFSVQYHASADEIVTIQLKDVAGRVLKTFQESVNKGQNLIYIQSMPNWLPGVYFVSVQDRNEIQQVKFVKSQ